MARRGRKRAIKLKMRADTAKSVLSVLLIVGGGLSLVSFIAPDYTLNSIIQDVIRGALGIPSILLGPIFIILGLLHIRVVKIKFVNLRVLFGLVALAIGSAGLFHLNYIRQGMGQQAAQDGLGGGRVGYFIANILESAMSIYGAVIILLAFMAISAIFVADRSLDEMLDFVKKKSGMLKALKNLKGEKDKSGDAKNEDDIKITSGTGIVDDEEGEEDEEEEIEIIKPSFEVVPSLSEPVSSRSVSVPKLNEKEVSSLASVGLPYTDKVWELPPTDLLEDQSNAPVDRGDVKARAKIIEDTLESFGIKVKVVEVNFGPTVTQYALETTSGTKIAKISNLQYDLALALASPTGSVRIEAPIPGKSLVGIEVPNNTRINVNFKSLLISDPMKGLKSSLGIVLGRDVSGQPRVYDISKMPHLLVAGATGSGKSVFLHSVMFSLLFNNSPAECKFILIDPKRVELVHYQEIPHLLTPVITDTDKAPSAFRWLVEEMERRYKLFESAKVRNIKGYNEKSGFQALSNIVVIVDEMAEIMVKDPAEVEKSVIRLGQLSRATGIHLILAVQRPSTNIITGLIKANIPSRIAFNVTNQVDSRVIIDQPGAEKLLGKGDMLFVPPDASKPIRVQGAFVLDKEINSLVTYLKSMGTPPDYKEEVLQTKASGDTKSVSAGGDAVDDLFEEALDVVVSAKKASASLLQRRLSIGYARAARILDELETKGIVGPSRGSRPREILATSIDEVMGTSNEHEDGPPIQRKSPVLE